MEELCETCQRCEWLYGNCDGCTEEEYIQLYAKFGEEFINNCHITEIW